MSDGSWVYYHSLYHLVTHWAAFVATLVLLITIGVVISASPMLRNWWYFTFAIIAGTSAALYFLLRMYTFGNAVNKTLNGATGYTEGFLKPPYNLLIGGLVTLTIAGLDFRVLWKSKPTTPPADLRPSVPTRPDGNVDNFVDGQSLKGQ